MVGYAPIPTPTHADAAIWGVILAICLAAISLLPALINWIWPVKRKYIENACGQCGYSLQGLPGDICPECGADTQTVGKRRARPRMANGTLFSCAAWIVLIFWLDGNYGFYLSNYLLRARYGIEAYGGTARFYYFGQSYPLQYSLQSYPSSSDISTALWYRAIELAILAIGLASILLVARWRRGRGNTVKPTKTTI